jgi:hypothetical protein
MIAMNVVPVLRALSSFFEVGGDQSLGEAEGKHGFKAQ